MVKSGASFSGRERHCAFLNLGGTGFANVSSVSGLDFPDDGRGAALSDWDGDGDLDLWVSNRTGPSARFLRNELDGGANFVALQLEGKTCNRDAIGARVEVRLEGSGPPVVRGLRAGDGFLSQSSKSLHIGLGASAAIEELIVHWPGGGAQRFSDIMPNRRYSIVQGSPPIIVKIAGRSDLPEVSLEGPEAEAASPIRVFTHAPIPLPALRYVGTDGKNAVVAAGRPVLLNLWASWCAPCVAELESFAASDSLREFGLEVIAISADRLNGDETKARALLEQVEWPFRSGFANRQFLQRCQMIHDFVFDLHEPIPIPTSFLIDGAGNLQAIFKGPVEPDWLIGNIGKMMQAPPSGDARRKLVSGPFAGRWIGPARRLSFAPIAEAIAAQDPIDDALEYFEKNRQILGSSPQAARLYVALGAGLEKTGRSAEAKAFYLRALERFPSYLEARQRLEALETRATPPADR